MYNKYSISREKKSIMLKTFENKLKTFENKFDYLINYKRNEFDLVRQISKKKFNLSIQLIEKAIKLKKNIFVCGNGVQHRPLIICHVMFLKEFHRIPDLNQKLLVWLIIWN